MDKCSLRKHKYFDAISFCEDCNRYMCKKCQTHHDELFEEHDLRILNEKEDSSNLFTGYCKEKGHTDALEYFCKKHNKLCCASCISKIQSKGNGQHKDCDVCNVEEIKSDKEKILKDNIKILEDLLNSFEKLMEEFKINFEKANKETLKIKIKNIFDQIKEAVNEREKEILTKIDYLLDNDFQYLVINEEKKYKRTFTEINDSIEKSKELVEESNNINKMNKYINECLNIENNVQKLGNDIIKIKEKINIENINSGIRFYPEKDTFKKFLDKIKKFGYIFPNTDNFKFKKCVETINKNKLYTISANNENILTKSGDDGWVGVLCQNGLDDSRDKYTWKIKILKTYNGTIMVGAAPIDFDINSSSYDNCGWYFYCYSSVLYSGYPHFYKNKKTDLKKPQKEIKIILNMKRRTLNFIVDGEDKDESYLNIEDEDESYLNMPIDKPIVPTVFLYHKNDSVEIMEC